MKLSKKIKNAVLLINEGLNLKDKLILALYFAKAPFNRSKRLLLEVAIKTKYGLFCCGDNIISVYDASSLFEGGIKEFIYLREGAFIDVGANLGKYSVIAGKQHKRNKIISIEPVRSNLRLLQKNIKLNKLDNVVIIPKACYKENKELLLYLDQIGTSHHSIYKKTKKKTRVPAERLDSIIKRLKIKKVDQIKIDVEGAEPDVLEGAKNILRRDHPNIIFEAWNHHNLLKVVRVLKPFNYSITKIAFENYLAR